MPSDFSAGFQTSTTEVVIFLALLGFMVLGLIVYAIRQRLRRGAKRTPTAAPVLRSSGRRRFEQLDLSSRDRRVYDHLVWFLKDPSRPEKLLEDEALLLRIARQSIREGIATEPEVIRLLSRLEVDTSQLRHGQKSTHSIPIHAEVSIADRELHTAVGEILSIDARGLHVHCDKGHRRMAAGNPVEVLSNSGEGLFRFQSVIGTRRGKELLLHHSNHVETIQRRQYRRRYASLPVAITMPGVDTPPLSTETVDLSIGGVAVRNPRKRLDIGTIVNVTLDAEGAAPLMLQGTVLRTTSRNRIAHIVFGRMEDAQRHRLFRRLLRLGAGEGRRGRR